MIIEYYKKNVYGNSLYYVKNIEIRKAVSRITGKATIDRYNIDDFKYLGIEFVEVIEGQE